MQTRVHFIRHGTSASIGVMSCSLSIPDEAKENEKDHLSDIVADANGIQTCLKAVIGLGYNGQSNAF